MQRTAALQEKFEMLIFDVGPNNNQFTAIGNLVHAIAAVHSRRVEAAFAASTLTGQKKQKKN